MIYSRLPRENYTTIYNGETKGLGVHPVFAVVPGAWNLLWLRLGPDLEDLLSWSKPPGQFPCSLAALAPAVATALQHCSPGSTFGDLAESLSPTKLISAMKASPVVPFMSQIYGDMWYQVATEHARAFVPCYSNVIMVDFKNRAPVIQ